MSEDNGLPLGWAKARVDSLVHLINGCAFKPTQWKSEGLPIIRIQNLNNPDAPFNYCSEILPEKFRVQNSDLLFAWSGTPGTSFGAHIWRGEEAWLNQHIFKVLFDREHLDERFLRLAINQNLESYIRQAHGGAGLAHITKGRFEESELLVAPLVEQRRIVAKIEELFSDLDAGAAALERAKANLKRYRAAVLKAAVEGKLTEEWRAEHPAKEPASALLARILKERRQKWEANQLAKFAAAGKEPPKNWKAKYVEPTPPDTTRLPELPEGWCWATVEQVAETVRYGSSAKTNEDADGIPVLRMGNIVDGKLDWTELKYLPRNHEEFPDLLLNAGDLLFNRTNSAELVGKSAIYDGNHDPCSYASYLIAVRTILGCNSDFLCMFINSAHGRRWVKSVVSQQVGQANVNGTKLQALAFPFPPLAEQQQIVTEVAERLSQIQAAETEIDHGLRRAARLRQSILKQAFSGKLVPQDPTDEPASVLLERLREGRTDANGTASVRKRRAKT